MRLYGICRDEVIILENEPPKQHKYGIFVGYNDVEPIRGSRHAMIYVNIYGTEYRYGCHDNPYKIIGDDSFTYHGLSMYPDVLYMNMLRKLLDQYVDDIFNFNTKILKLIVDKIKLTYNLYKDMYIEAISYTEKLLTQPDTDTKSARNF